MSETIIDRAYQDNARLLVICPKGMNYHSFEPQMIHFVRSLVLSAASLFEHKISEALYDYCARKSDSDACILALVRKKR